MDDKLRVFSASWGSWPTSLDRCKHKGGVWGVSIEMVLFTPFLEVFARRNPFQLVEVFQTCNPLLLGHYMVQPVAHIN